MKPTIVLLIVIVSVAVSCQLQGTDNIKQVKPVFDSFQGKDGINSRFSDEYEKCRSLISRQSFKDAEDFCRLSLSYAEELPNENYLKRYNAQKAVGTVLLRRIQPSDAIQFLEEALMTGKRVPDDTNLELGEVYFLLGQAHYQLHNLDKTLDFYARAEDTYRSAFQNVDDNEIRSRYAGMLLWILEIHSVVLEEANMKDEAVEVELRIYKTRKEYAKYLKN